MALFFFIIFFLFGIFNSFSGLNYLITLKKFFLNFPTQHTNHKILSKFFITVVLLLFFCFFFYLFVGFNWCWNDQCATIVRLWIAVWCISWISADSGYTVTIESCCRSGCCHQSILWISSKYAGSNFVHRNIISSVN